MLAGALLLVEAFIDLSAWVWVALLALGGLGAFGLYLTDRSEWWMLVPAYALWVIAVLVALVTLNVLGGEAVAFYVLLAVGLPFLAVYYRDRALWWALIPAYVLIVIAVMILLIGLGVLSDLLVPAYIMIAIAVPFFVVYARDRSLWWALIPGGILAVIGLSFLIAGAAVEYIGALVLLVVGGWLLLRAFRRREPPDTAPPDLEVSKTSDSEEEDFPSE
jgi:hypothetical protein